MEKQKNGKMSSAEFEQRIYVFYPRVLRVCNRILRNVHLAEEAAQEAMLKAWDKFSEFQGLASLDTWVCRIAINEAVSVIRKRKYRPEVPLEEWMEFLDTGPDPHTCYARKQALLVLRRLSLRRRTMLTLRYLEDRSIEETAKIMGTTLGAVKSSVHWSKVELQEFANQQYL